MSWQDFLALFDVATRILGAIAIVLVWVMSRMFVTHKELQHRFEQHDTVHNQIASQLGQGATHFARVDGDLKHAPTHEDIEGLRHDIGELKATVAALDASSDERTARIERIEKNVDRLLDFQLNGGGK
jgi:hypothetical protein